MEDESVSGLWLERGLLPLPQARLTCRSHFKSKSRAADHWKWLSAGNSAADGSHSEERVATLLLSLSLRTASTPPICDLSVTLPMNLSAVIKIHTQNHLNSQCREGKKQSQEHNMQVWVQLLSVGRQSVQKQLELAFWGQIFWQTLWKRLFSFQNQVLHCLLWVYISMKKCSVQQVPLILRKSSCLHHRKRCKTWVNFTLLCN